ncbi:MAG: gallidermin family lantibiotic [Lactobacillaceae bacterium]
MSNTQLLEVLDANVMEGDLFSIDSVDSVAMSSNDDPDSRFKSWSLCTAGCAKTGSFNSYCC